MYSPDLLRRWKIGDILLNRFKIVDNKMHGGMGIVYKVLDLRVKNFKAVKTYQKERIFSGQTIPRFKEEAKIWIQLGSHPNIVKAMFVEEVQGQVAVFMEYIEGDNLANLIYNRSLDSQISLAFIIQFCRGMIHAQTKIPGIVHSDIKPENALIDVRNGILKITDWGLAKTTYYASEMPFGTYLYMAPERFQDAALIDMSSDIYSFGIMFYLLLTNNFPYTFPRSFSKDSWHSLLCTERPSAIKRYRSDLPTQLESLVMSCIERRKENRPRSFDEIEKVLSDTYFNEYGLTLGVEEKIIRSSEYERLCDLAASFIAIDMYDDAIGACKRATKIKRDAPAAWINMGIALERKNCNEEALESYDSAIAADPKERLAWNNRGNVLRSLNRFNEAEQSYVKALQLDPNYERAWNNKGFLLIDLQRYQEALECFDNALNMDPNYVDAWNNRSIALTYLGQNQEALESIERALAIYPGHINSLNNHAMCLFELHRYQEALDESRSLLYLNENSYMAHNLIGMCLNGLGRNDEAEKSFKKALALSDIGNKHSVLFNMGNLLNKLGRYEEALRLLEQAVCQNKNEAKYYAELGFTQHQLGEHQLALKSYEQAESLNCLVPDMYYNYAVLLSGFQQYESAIKRLKRAISLRADFPNAYNSLGVVLHMMGRYEEAISKYNQCLNFEPNHARAHNNLGLSLIKVGKPSEAEAAYLKALDIKPNYSECWRNLGNLQIEQKNIEQAKKSFETAVAIAPDDYRTWVNLSALALENNDPSAAVDCAMKALEANPGFEPAKNNLDIAQSILRKTSKTAKISENVSRSDNVDRDHSQEITVSPNNLVSIKLIILERENMPDLDCRSLSLQIYKYLNHHIYMAIDKLNRLHLIKTECLVCPSDYEQGMSGFAVATGRNEVDQGHSVVVQNDIECKIINGNTLETLRVTVLSILNDLDSNGKPYIGFLIGNFTAP